MEIIGRPFYSEDVSSTLHSDFRPITRTPIVAKVFESLVKKWVRPVSKECTYENQSGASPEVSTADALLDITNQWFRELDEPGKYIKVLQLDYSSALINLINKLATIGIPLLFV